MQENRSLKEGLPLQQNSNTQALLQQCCWSYLMELFFYILLVPPRKKTVMVLEHLRPSTPIGINYHYFMHTCSRLWGSPSWLQSRHRNLRVLSHSSPS
eukprot:659081-Amphidinium_carterae.1